MAQKLLAAVLFLLIGGALHAQSVDEMVDQAKQLEKQMKEADALARYKEILKVQPEQLAALVEASELSSREGNRRKEKEEKARYFGEAKSYAEEALKLAPNDPGANYAMSVAMGRMALISGAKEKVAASRDVKRYAELAIKFNPNHAHAYHVLGKWNYEVANLSFLEKNAAKALFGGMPDGSLQQAIDNYEKCRRLDPSFILNYYELARAYKKNDQETQAMEVLKKAVSLRNIYQDDIAIKADCKKMLEEMQ
jgi:tetratricopeptide (TPR) repeat protein